MTWGTRLFWGIMFFIGFHLFWLGLMEVFLPIWVATIISIGFIYWILKYGSRPKQKQTCAEMREGLNDDGGSKS